MSIRLSFACAMIAGTLVSAASAAPVLDQSNLPGQLFYNPLGPTYVPNQQTAEMAQTFTVGVGGTLTSVSAVLFTPYQVTINLSIVPVVAGVPDASTVLASASWSGQSNTPGFISFDVSAANLAVAPGDELAYWLTADQLSRFNTSSGNTYAGGSVFWRFPGATDGSPTSWSSIGLDAYFETYVEAVPGPGAAVLFGAGVLAAGRRRR